MLFIFSTTFASEYTVPRAAYSVYAEDLDLDGNKDIVVGHKYNSQTDWGGVSILENIGEGVFDFSDSLYFINGFAYVNGEYLDNNNYIDIFSQYVSNDPAPINNRFIGIVYNYGFQSFNNIIYFPLNTREPVHDITSGDIDNDNNIDIVVASHNGQFWGILYNDGTGQFSLPEYTFVDYYPGGIACGDLNNDDRDDIVVCGLKLEAYLSYPDSFQYILVDETSYMGNVKIADMNNDGFNDIITETWYVPGHYKDISIYFNNGGVNFNDVYVKVVEEAASELFVADLNNDNYPDIIYNVSYSYPNSLYEITHTYILFNNEDNTLQDPVNYQTYLGTSEYVTSFKSFAADVDNNSWKDIITVNYSYNVSSIHILYNDSTGNFIEEPQTSIENNEIQNPNVKLSNYPNPFNPETKIGFSIPEDSKVNLTIYNIKGQKVRALIKDQLEKGFHEIIWNSKDNNGKSVASGVYFYKFDVNGKTKGVKKMLLLK
jgi:hypothetical protein